MLLWLLALVPAAGWAQEVCNGIDDDGDGVADEGPVLVAPDEDGDGHGASAEVALVEGCEGQPELQSVGDCDDRDGGVGPGEGEECNARDDDCDGAIDEEGCGCDVVVDHGVWQLCAALVEFDAVDDACEEDDYRAASVSDELQQDALTAVVAPYAALSTGVWIGLSDREVEGSFAWIDGTDLGYSNWREGEPNDGNVYYEEDCAEMEDDGLWDDQLCTDLQPYVCEAECAERIWYADGDGDGLGAGTALLGCVPPVVGAVANALDCDDGDPALPRLGWADLDADGAGGDPLGVGCVGVSADGDCDDGDPEVAPGARESCDGVDEDCDGEVDEGSGGPWYEDADEDGFGAGPADEGLCAPAGWVDRDGDCDDSRADVYPGAFDPPGDGVDGDCSGADGAPPDADGDGALDPADPAPDDPGGRTGHAPSPGFGCGAPTGSRLGALIAAVLLRRRSDHGSGRAYHRPSSPKMGRTGRP